MILHTNGMALYYETHGRGEPLLWLHGAMGHGGDWRHIFDEAPDGYQVIAPDLRGHGLSTGAGPTYSFRQSALDAAALLDHLGVERIKVIGLSGGGITALHLAALAGARVSAMICVSAAAAFPETARAIQRSFGEEMLPRDERVRIRERHPRDGQVETLFAQVRAMADGADPDFSREALRSIAADVLIVSGDRDPLYPVPVAVHLLESIEHAWLWVVPNGGHGPVFGPFSPAFRQTALAFLAGSYRRGPGLFQE